MIKTTLLENKVAVVAGGGRGIGNAISNTLAESGANVVVVDLERERAESTVAEIKKNGGKASPYVLDVRDNAAIEKMVADVGRDHGGIDVLVNNAGGAFAYTKFRPMVEWSEEDFDMIINRNLRYVFLTSRAVIKSMLAARRGGSIVNIASISGMISAPNHAAYGAAKAGLIMFTRTIALENAPFGIRANCVSPGSIATPAVMTPGETRDRGAGIPMGRPGQPLDIAKAVLFFASPLTDYVTGQVILVDGGAGVKFPLGAEATAAK